MDYLWVGLALLTLFFVFTYVHMVRRRERDEREHHAKNMARTHALMAGIEEGLRQSRAQRRMPTHK